MSVLVPARDEARRLPKLLPGLLAQPADEILVLDDQSSDGTADVVCAYADPRLRLIPGRPRPDGWIGKNWACHQLAEAATGELLVFCDADVVLRPGALDAILHEARRQRADVFSVFPRQLTGSPGLGERLLVPLIDETLLAFLPHRLLDLPVPSAAAANGQLLAFWREAYTTIGGHEAVHDRIVEDVALARRARRLGLKLGLALGGDLVQARMYDDYRQTVAGLGKSLRAAHLSNDAVVLASAAFHVTAYTVPWLRWRHGRAWRIAAVLGLAERVLANAKTGRGAYAEAALVPITPLAALPVYATALRRKARWKGRVYP
ncbi:glycosyltransferase involved in cell wall biosynthesis [Hamadaea flava]|uniref:Glycosyltransferase family 2 protein n=1 Tax=Hamadaea flava TaxID=1742688 RepID=A0ABV8LR08_9ACTN|nr:glycosyltransferase [Hamadaea flava]MCP2322629.1 glycosyltransferase involved in cell wall biosynthesis [Hamadaea flava]